MPGQVFADKRGDEMVAVVAAFLHTQRDRATLPCVRRLQILRVELFGQELVIGALALQITQGEQVKDE